MEVIRYRLPSGRERCFCWLGTDHIKRLHIHINKNDVNNIRNFSDITPCLRHIVRDVLLQLASFLKDKDRHHMCK